MGMTVLRVFGSAFRATEALPHRVRACVRARANLALFTSHFVGKVVTALTIPMMLMPFLGTNR